MPQRFHSPVGKPSSGMAGYRCSDSVAGLILHLSTLFLSVLLCVMPRGPPPATTLHSVTLLLAFLGSPEPIT